MKKNQNNIDSLFAQVRAASEPTPLKNLVDARPSGALFALKKSTSVTINGLWTGIICSVFALAVLAGTGYFLFGKIADAPQQKVRQYTVSQPAINKADQPTAYREIHHETSANEPREKIKNHEDIPSASSRSDQRTYQSAQQETAVRMQQQIPSLLDAASSPFVAMSNRMIPNQEFPSSVLQPKFSIDISSSISHNVSVTLDAIPLTSGILQIHGELQGSKNLSYGAILGVGSIRDHSTNTRYAIWVSGGQLNYYLTGNFDNGLQIGTQALFSITNSNAQKSTYDNGRALSLISYAGYKMTLSSGLTFNAQAGVGATAPIGIGNSASDGSNSPSSSGWHMSAQMHCAIGWSF